MKVDFPISITDWDTITKEKHVNVYVEAWKNGGCVVCGDKDRDGAPKAHWKCWDSLNLAQKQGILNMKVPTTSSVPAKLCPTNIASTKKSELFDYDRAELDRITRIICGWQMNSATTKMQHEYLDVVRTLLLLTTHDKATK